MVENDTKSTRYEEGRVAYRKGGDIESLRTTRPYGTFGQYSEAVENLDRIAGFLDAMAEQIRDLADDWRFK